MEDNGEGDSAVVLFFHRDAWDKIVAAAGESLPKDGTRDAAEFKAVLETLLKPPAASVMVGDRYRGSQDYRFPSRGLANCC